MKECLKCKQMLNNDQFFSFTTIRKRRSDNLPEDICKKCFSEKNKRSFDLIPTNEFFAMSKMFLRQQTLKPVRWDMTLC